MRKWLSILLIATVFLTSFQIGFGATGLSDIKRTPYEEAVTELVNKGIINGYKDGTFQPERALNRAEACIIIVNSLLYPDGDMETETDSRFIDLQGYSWAKSYIDYAYSRRIISGDGDRTFRPDDTVMYCEFFTMLVNAAGFRGEYLEGQWPQNFMDKAQQMGLFEGLSLRFPQDQDEIVTRGNAAVILKNAQKYLEGIYSSNYSVKAEKGRADGEIGTRMETLLFQYVVNSVESYKEYGEITTSDGNRLIVASITMKNITNNPVPMYDADFLIVFGDNQASYCLDAADYTMMPQSFELLPGEEATYNFVFDVPKDETDLAVFHVEQFEGEGIGDRFFVNFTMEKEPEEDDTLSEQESGPQP